MSTSYPKDLPVAQGLEIVSIVRDGELLAKKAIFAYNLWVLQGFVQRTLFGDPTAPSNSNEGGVVLTPSAVPADFNAVNELEKLFVNAQSGIAPQATIPWLQILQWAIAELAAILAAE